MRCIAKPLTCFGLSYAVFLSRADILVSDFLYIYIFLEGNASALVSMVVALLLLLLLLLVVITDDLVSKLAITIYHWPFLECN